MASGCDDDFVTGELVRVAEWAPWSVPGGGGGVGPPIHRPAERGQVDPVAVSPSRHHGPMKLPNGLFGCEHCGCTFERPSRRGRHPHYCSRTCRQRAYEARRRGAHALGLPRAPLPRPRHTRSFRPAYETGIRYPVRHALRPDGAPDARNFRPTLCGTRARTSPMRFEPWLRGEIPGQRSCRTCSSLARRFPPTIAPDAPADLARARHLLGRLRAGVAGRCSDRDLHAAVVDVLAELDCALPLAPADLPPYPDDPDDPDGDGDDHVAR